MLALQVYRQRTRLRIRSGYFGKRYFGSSLGRFMTPDSPLMDQHTPNHDGKSRQLQPYVACGVGLQLRRKRPKNESLNNESRCQAEWPSYQKRTRTLFHIAVSDCCEQHAFVSYEENHSVVRRKTEWHLASRTSSNRSRVVAVCEAKLTH